MKRCLTFLLSLALCAGMLLTTVAASDISAQKTETRDGLSALDGRAGTLLRRGEEFPAGTSPCDWTAMALALSGSQECYDAYLKELQAYVEENYAASGKLDRVKATPYHRIALTVLALGGDPTDFGRKGDGSAIDLIADGTYAFAGDSLGDQGLNGWIYALLTLDASGVSVPENAKFTRDDMIDAIVQAQEPDGGFGLAAGSSDVDITAMALQALAPYRDSCPDVTEKALSYLSSAMNEHGRYASYGTESAESSAQVLLALCALGIDPEGDDRFSGLMAGLEGFRLADGTYGHTPEDTQGNFLATAQTLLALTALENLRTNTGWIFDFTNYAGPQQRPQHGIYYAATGIVLALVVCAVILRKRKHNGKTNG